MFSIDFESPRFKSVLRTLQYAFLTVFVVAGTIILVYAGQGYDINRETGQVIQNGLLLVNSTPGNATVFIDEEPESDLTPSRFPLPEGSYEVWLTLDGYRTWTKQLSVAGSSVEWVYYPRLLPEELETSNVAALRNVEFIGQSPGGQNFLVRQRSNEPSFNLISISDNALTNDERITVANDLFELRRGSGFGDMSFEGWANDNSSVLVRHRVGSQVEYVLLDTEEPAESLNLSQEYDLDLRDVRFVSDEPDQFFALVGQDLRRLDLSNGTISTPLVRDVERYVLHAERFIIYLRTDDEGLQLGLYDDNDDEHLGLQSLEGRAGRYRLEFSSYDNEFHLAMLDRQHGRVTVWVDPHERRTADDNDSQPRRFIIPADGARNLSFSRNGQYLLAQGGDRFYTHDFDRTRRHSFTVDFEVSDQAAKWLDGNYLMVHDTDDTLHLFEFDGGYEHSIITSDPEFDVFPGNDFQNLYTLTLPENGGRVFMQSTSLIVDQPGN